MDISFSLLVCQLVIAIIVILASSTDQITSPFEFLSPGYVGTNKTKKIKKRKSHQYNCTHSGRVSGGHWEYVGDVKDIFPPIGILTH